MKKILGKIFAKIVYTREQKWIENPIESQQKVLRKLLLHAKETQFGKDHFFEKIDSYADFKLNVPLRDYEQLKPYINQIIEGKENVLWKGKPLYFAQTSGTTSGAKYIPITKESMPFHVKAARNALLNYIQKTQNSEFINGKMIFLQGSPVLEEKNGISTGRLSGIVAHFVPKYLQKNRLPSWETNCIEDWEEKVEVIIEETWNENMTLISGIPPWLIMYFEKLIEKTGKKVGELFPNLQLIVTGGVNYEPYREKMNTLLGKEVDIIQTFPASEGFMAYQNELNDESLLLLLNHGIFYEFVPLEESEKGNPERIALKDVELNKDYEIILNTNAGLWGYRIGDTVRFTSLKPYKIVVSGRIKHYTSAFGEHVIAHEVENALKNTLEKFPCEITEFHVAPQVNPTEGLPYHEWFIEFNIIPHNLDKFSQELNQQMRKQNKYYDDLIEGKILQPLKITKIQPNGFNNYMKSIGKLGGQNKTPRLANDRKLADKLFDFKEV